MKRSGGDITLTKRSYMNTFNTSFFQKPRARALLTQKVIVYIFGSEIKLNVTFYHFCKGFCINHKFE